MEEVVLLNVVELGPQIGFASDTFELMLAWKKDAEPRLADLKKRIETNGIRCRWRLELVKPSLEIVRVAEEERAALIAIGTHGHGFVRGILLGSVTHDVVRHASCSCSGPKGHGDRQVGEDGLRLCLSAHFPAGSVSDRFLRLCGRGARIG